MSESDARNLRYCCMPSCKNEKFDLVHKFPRNNEKAKQWLDAINIEELSAMSLDALRRKKFICSRHFAPQAYKHEFSRSLNLTAIPTLNLTTLESTDHVIHRERKPLVMDVEYIEPIEEEDLVPPRKIHRKINPVEVPQETSGIQLKAVQLKPVGPSLLKKSVPKSMEKASLQNIIVLETNIMSPPLLETKEPETEPLVSEKSDPCAIILSDDDCENYPQGIKLNYYWLRDHCRCDICYDKNRSRRKYNFMDIPLDIAPKFYEVVKDAKTLNVTWCDEHKSTYDLDFLYNSQFEIKRSMYERSPHILWNQENIQNYDYARVNLTELITEESAVRKILLSLVKYGVAFIEKVPANVHSTEMAVTRLFPVMRTFFGDMWKFSDHKDHLDFAYTTEYLPAHTDNTYFNDAAALQILHCIQHDGSGGENLLVDGFKAVSDLKTKYFDSYERLAFKYQIPSEYVEEGRHHVHRGPVIQVNQLTKSVEQIRFNMNDRAALDTIPFDDLQQFYVDYHRLATEIQSSSNEWWFKLDPGTVLIFDNWRILHGRQSYTGKRVMTGCYVSRTEFLSAARTYNAL